MVSDYGVDRQRESFALGAWDTALARLRQSGKAVPVLFGHAHDSLSAVLGMVPPHGWRVDGAGLWAEGWIDVADSVGQKVYKLLKSGALQWSVGFTSDKGSPGRDGTRVIARVHELLELSVTPLPANPRTRTHSAKSTGHIPSLKEVADFERKLFEPPELTKLRAQMRDEMMIALGSEPHD